MSSPIGILLLEDDPNDAGLIEALLEADHFVCRITWVQSRTEFLAALENPEFDLILSDYKLPLFDGLSALKLALSVRPDLPFIFVSGTLGEEAAIEALKVGATDYVLKTRMSRLVPAMRRALGEAGDRAARRRAEDALRQREKELRDVVGAIPAIAFTAQPDGSSLWINRQWVEFSGLSVEETSGSGWQSAIHPDDLIEHAAKWHHSMTSGEPFENEARHRGVNGEYRWFLVRVVPRRDERGKILKWYGILTDITDRKRAEAELRESEQNYRTLFESIDEGFCTIEVLFDQNEKPVDYRFLQTSPSFERQTGIKNAAGRRMREIAPQHEEHWFEIYGRIALTGEPMRFENEAKQLGRWYDVYAFRVEGPKRRCVGILFNDITERKRAEAELRASETKRYLIETERLAALGRLVAGVAHELNSPVGISLTVASTLARRCSSFAQQIFSGPVRRSRLAEFTDGCCDAANQLVVNLQRAGELIQSFKQVAVDRSLADRRTFDLKLATEQIVASVRPGLPSYRDSLALELPSDIVMDSYPGAYGQVLINLIFNAVTHGFADRPGGHVLIKARRLDMEWVEITFSDDGGGIPEEVQRHVFDPFFTTRRAQGSTGLGLYIVHNLVTEQLGGRITLVSAREKGTTIFMTLPLLAPGQSEQTSAAARKTQVDGAGVAVARCSSFHPP